MRECFPRLMLLHGKFLDCKCCAYSALSRADFSSVVGVSCQSKSTPENCIVGKPSVQCVGSVASVVVVVFWTKAHTFVSSSVTSESREYVIRKGIYLEVNKF